MANLYFKRELFNKFNKGIYEYFVRRMADRKGGTSRGIVSNWKREVVDQLLISDPAKTLQNIMGTLPRNGSKFKSLGLTIPSHAHPEVPTEKEYDIFFVTSSGSASRRNFARAVANFAKEENLKAFVLTVGGFYGGVPWNEYVEKLMASKVAIAHPGNGFYTIRYWEIPYYGTALASPVLPIKIENNFKDMESAILFSNFSDFRKKIRQVLKDDKWRRIASEGQKVFINHHTAKMRAKTILDNI